MSALAGLSVALVILTDIATGQGPQNLNNYLAALGGPDYRGGPQVGPQIGPQVGPLPIQPLQPVIVAYPPQGEFDGKNIGNYKGEKEFAKEKEYSKEKEGHKIHHLGYGPGYAEKSTPAPGVLSSFSNSMSDAWKTFTNLGRQTRDTREKRSTEADANPTGDDQQTEGGSTARSMDEYEWKQFNNQGYIFFKVPRSLVCYNNYNY